MLIFQVILYINIDKSVKDEYTQIHTQNWSFLSLVMMETWYPTMQCTVLLTLRTILEEVQLAKAEVSNKRLHKGSLFSLFSAFLYSA